MCYIPNDWKLSQNYVEPFTFVRSLILLDLQPSKEVSFFSARIIFCRLGYIFYSIYKWNAPPITKSWSISNITVFSDAGLHYKQLAWFNSGHWGPCHEQWTWSWSSPRGQNQHSHSGKHAGSSGDNSVWKLELALTMVHLHRFCRLGYFFYQFTN